MTRRGLQLLHENPDLIGNQKEQIIHRVEDAPFDQLPGEFDEKPFCSGQVIHQIVAIRLTERLGSAQIPMPPAKPPPFVETPSESPADLLYGGMARAGLLFLDRVGLTGDRIQEMPANNAKDIGRLLGEPRGAWIGLPDCPMTILQQKPVQFGLERSSGKPIQIEMLKPGLQQDVVADWRVAARELRQLDKPQNLSGADHRPEALCRRVQDGSP